MENRVIKKHFLEEKPHKIIRIILLPLNLMLKVVKKLKYLSILTILLIFNEQSSCIEVGHEKSQLTMYGGGVVVSDEKQYPPRANHRKL